MLKIGQLSKVELGYYINTWKDPRISSSQGFLVGEPRMRFDTLESIPVDVIKGNKWNEELVRDIFN